MMRLLKKLIHYYMYHMKMQTKFIFSHLFLILIPTIVVAVFLYGQIYNLVAQSTVNSEQIISKQTAVTLRTKISQISSGAAAIMENEQFQMFFQHPEQIMSDAAIRDTSDIVTALADGIMDSDLISDITIYYEEAYSYLSLRPELTSSVYQPARNIRSSYWYGIFSSADTDSLLCPGLYLTPDEITDKGEFAWIQQVSTTPEEGSVPVVTAYIVIYFHQDVIDEILEQNSTVTDSVTYIVNDRSTLVSTSDAALSGTYAMLDQNHISEIVETPDLFVTYTFMDENIYIGYHEIEGTDWYMVTAIPQDTLMEKGTGIIFWFVFIYAVFLLLALFLAIWLSRSISRRLSTVVSQMETVRSGKPARLEQPFYEQDEIGNLKDTYNYMTDEINHLMDEQEQAARDLHLSEFKALQSQINPHFLYNTLDMINWLSLSDQKEELADVVQSLSRFYKLTLNKKDALVPVHTEIEHISLYMNIQNIRYENNLNLVVDIPDSIMDCTIPKLTFQPIIENGIQHGIMMKEEKQGTIVLTGWPEENDVVFLISDDGAGMSMDLCNRILRGEYENKNSSNIGVYNTHHRLQLLYGSNYGLTYQSEPGIGTEVEIRIPYQKEPPA